MKTILIIGMGHMGEHLCKNLSRMENQIMIVDKNESAIQEYLPYVTNARIGDCTNEEVLRSLGIGNFDVCFVCIGNDFQCSLEITNLLKEIGAKRVVSLANRDIQAKFLLRNGADEIIYPDRDIAERLAVRYSVNGIFDYMELADGYAIYEIPPLAIWIGKSVKELNFRGKYNINILGTKKDGRTDLMLSPDYIFSEDEHLMIVGRNEDVDKILKCL